jgi:carnitine O-acetyltransferase
MRKCDAATDVFHCHCSCFACQGINIIDSALFVVCLDNSSPDTAESIASNCLHGSSVVNGHVQSGSCINRWFDKSLQIIVCSNGMAG